MNEKTVTHAVTEIILPQPIDATKRAIDLLIAKEGTFRTEERWVHDALKDPIDNGHIIQEGASLSAGADFEGYLLSLSTHHEGFADTLVNYRSLIQSKIQEYNVSEFSVMQELSEIASTDEKIVYLTSVVADTFAKLNLALEKTQMLEAKLNEMDLSLAVMESVTFDEDSDG